MPADAATMWPNYQEADFTLKDYVFASGETLPELRLHYRTLGTARRNAAGKITNGVLLLQGNTGTGANWLRPSLADELFMSGQPLGAAQYFMIMPDAIGRGGSSKPSDGLKGKFPRYRYHDMVETGYRLISEGLDVAHLRLVIGSSMGGMHAWMWAEMYPDLMDGVIPISCQPVEISGRNWLGRRAQAEAIRHDPDWNNGFYEANPRHYIYAAAGNFGTESPTRIQEMAPNSRRRQRALRAAPRPSRQGRRQQLAMGDRGDHGLQPGARFGQDQGQGDADQRRRGSRQSARARHGRAGDEAGAPRPLCADPGGPEHTRALQPFLRRAVEALSDRVHADP